MSTYFITPLIGYVKTLDTIGGYSLKKDNICNNCLTFSRICKIVEVQLKWAIFKSYGNWQNMMSELDELSHVSGASQEEISLYMKGLNNSLSVNSRVKLCEYLKLDPDDFPELAYRTKTKPTVHIGSCEQLPISPVCNKDAQWISTWILNKLKNTTD